jgi:TRAP-type mannitol/chloroaromatic compound transport system substrate-binding protein
MKQLIKKIGLIAGLFLFTLNVNVKAAENWRIQSHLPSGHTVYQFMSDWIDGVNVMLGGRLTLEIFPGKAIIPPNETLEAVKMGIIDGDLTSPAYFAGRDPAMPLLADLIGAYSNWFEAATWCEYGGGKELFQKMYDGFGAQFVGCPNAGIESVASKKPINSIADFKGVKMRAPSGTATSLLKAMGASPVNLSGGEVYSALEKGVIDAADLSDYVANKSLGLHKVAKYAIVDFHSMPVLSFTVNKKKWNAQPKDIQAILTMAARDMGTQINMRQLMLRGPAEKDDLDNHGVTIIDWPASERKKMRAMAAKIWEVESKKSDFAKQAYDNQVGYLKTIRMLD